MVAPPARRKKHSPAKFGSQPLVAEPDTGKSLRTSHFPDGVELLTSREVADILIVDIRLLADWRYQNKYLPYFSVGNQVRYDREAVITFLEKNVNSERDVEVTPRERENIRKHLNQVIDLIREKSVSDVAAFVVMGGGLSYGVLTESQNGRNRKSARRNISRT